MVGLAEREGARPPEKPRVGGRETDRLGRTERVGVLTPPEGRALDRVVRRTVDLDPLCGLEVTRFGLRCTVVRVGLCEPRRSEDSVRRGTVTRRTSDRSTLRLVDDARLDVVARRGVVTPRSLSLGVAVVRRVVVGRLFTRRPNSVVVRTALRSGVTVLRPSLMPQPDGRTCRVLAFEACDT